MRIVFFGLLFLTYILTSCKSNAHESAPQEDRSKLAEEKYRNIGEIIELDPALQNNLSKDAKIEVLAEGFEWSEGPVWVEEGNFLLFSDIPQNSIFKWKEGEGKSLYLKPAGYTGKTERAGESGSNGLLLDANARLVLCQHGDRRIARMEAPLDKPASEFTSLGSTYNGMRFNSPNDATFHSNGDLYLTDPPYGLVNRMEDPAKEIPFQGVYKLDPKGEVTLMTKELKRPNGVALSKDESILYVANSDPKHPVIMAYSLDKNGNTGSGEIFFDAKHLMVNGAKGLPDGLKVGKSGTVFATGPGGVLVLSPEGKHLGTISTGEATSNCAFDKEETYLYATSDMYLVRVKLKNL